MTRRRNRARGAQGEPPGAPAAADRSFRASRERPAGRDARAPRPSPKTSTAAATPFTADTISLDGAWELAWAEKGAGPPQSGWRTVAVPGDVHIQWLDAAKLYTREAEWLSGKEWWYRRKFAVPARFGGKRLRVQFEATDYYADTYLNGRRVGRHEGYIDPYEYDVSGVVRGGAENEIAVRVWTPVHYYWKHRPYTIKGAYGAVNQKPDDITALGITRPVRLVAGGPAAGFPFWPATAGPGVLQIRSQDVLPSAIGTPVLRAIRAAQPHLQAGALVTVDPFHRRIRLLPI